MMDFVSWDDDIPNWMESHKIHVPNHQPAEDGLWTAKLLQMWTRHEITKHCGTSRGHIILVFINILPIVAIQSLLMLMAKKGFHNAPQLGTLMRSYVLVRPKIKSAKYMMVHFSSYRFFHMKVAKVLMGCHWAHRPWISMDFQHTQTS